MDERSEKENVVDINVNASNTKRQLVSKYPPEWRTFCWEIIQEFRSEISRLVGRQVGWPTIYNKILQFIHSETGTEISELDTLFGRTSFTLWATGEKGLGDAKFKFIDFFINHEISRASGALQGVSDKIIEMREIHQLTVMKDLYLGGWSYNGRFDFKSASFPTPENSKEHTYHYFAYMKFVTEGPLPVLYFRGTGKIGYVAIMTFCDGLTSADYEDSDRFWSKVLSSQTRYYGFMMPTKKDDDGKSGVMNLFNRKMYSQIKNVGLTTAYWEFNVHAHTMHFRSVDMVCAPRVLGDVNDENQMVVDQYSKLGDDYSCKLFTNFSRFNVVFPPQSRFKEFANLKDKYLLW